MLRVAVAAVALVAAGAGAQAPRRSVATLPFEAGVIAIEARGDGHVVVGGASGDSTATVVLRVARAREWADAVARILRAPAGRRAAHRYRSVVTDSASGAGISFSRSVAGGVSTYGLFFADTSYGGFPLALSAREARLFLDKLRAGVRAAQQLAAQPRASPAPSAAADSSP